MHGPASRGWSTDSAAKHDTFLKVIFHHVTGPAPGQIDGLNLLPPAEIAKNSTERAARCCAWSNLRMWCRERPDQSRDPHPPSAPSDRPQSAPCCPLHCDRVAPSFRGWKKQPTLSRTNFDPLQKV